MGRKLRRWLAWAPLMGLPLAAMLLAPADWPRWGVMWLLSVAVFAGCKWLSWYGGGTRIREGAPRWRRAAYWLAWPGLDPAEFTAERSSGLAPPDFAEWCWAAGKLLLGAAVFWSLPRMVPDGYPLVTGWLGMIGLVLMLHFGAFHVLSCFWRRLGAGARPLMHNPLAASSLSDFWSCRWNTAFRDLAHDQVYCPLAPRVGPRWATAAVFGASGLVHDLVISLPARGGYGLPTLYFALQAAGLFAERSRGGRAAGLRRGALGWLFTAAVVVLPAGLLFHAPFVRNVMLPFMRALGACST